LPRCRNSEPEISSDEFPMTLHTDFASPDYFRDPAAAIAKLRAAGPVVEVRFPIIGKVWATTTQALADQVLKDTATFTIRKDNGDVAGLQWWMPGVVRTLANSMLSMDEPDHKRLRDIVDEAFRRRAVLDMEPHIEARSLTNLPISCSRKGVPPISSSAMRASCRSR
jgi:cytochrome P450